MRLAASGNRQPARRTSFGRWTLEYTREAPAIEVDQGIKGEQVDAVTRDALMREAPKAISVANGPEFLSKALNRWAYENAVTLDFGRPGEPTNNAFVESFNGRLQDECLNTRWFL